MNGIDDHLLELTASLTMSKLKQILVEGVVMFFFNNLFLFFICLLCFLGRLHFLISSYINFFLFFCKRRIFAQNINY